MTASKESKNTGQRTISSGKKVIFILPDHHVAYLDHSIADIRAKRGGILKRTELLRGILEALSKRKVDFSQATSEADITAILTRKLKA